MEENPNENELKMKFQLKKYHLGLLSQKFPNSKLESRFKRVLSDIFKVK